MKIFLVWFFSLLLAGVIISPFFWLQFLGQKSQKSYLIVSSIATLFLFWIYIDFIYALIGDWTAKISADCYYFFYDVVDFAIYLVIFLIIISPFIFTKINKTSFSLKRFLLDLFLSAFIFSAIFLYWAYVLLPKAFQDLHNHF